MSNKSSSSGESGSSTNDYSPPYTGSYDSRPSRRRQHSFTHVFPSNPPVATRNKPQKTTTITGTNKKQGGSSTQRIVQLGQDDRTKQFYSGLEWLLEATSSSRESLAGAGKSDIGTPLTKGDLRQFNSRKTDNRLVTEVNGQESALSD